MLSAAPLASISCHSTGGNEASPQQFVAKEWKALADLPDPAGLAGVYAGVIGDTLFVAGGSNFPDAPPWRGGTKSYSAKLYQLGLAAGDAGTWATASVALPHPAAYGVTIATHSSLLLIGGCNMTQSFDSVYQLKKDSDSKLTIQSLPSLPKPLAYMSGAIAGDKVFVVGGQTVIDNPTSTKVCFMLDLASGSSADSKWVELPACPGPGRTLPAVAATVRDGKVSLSVFSGRCVVPNSPTIPLKDAYRFDVAQNSWTALPALPHCVMAAAASADDTGRISLYGGDSAEIFMQLEEMRAKLPTLSAPEKPALQQKINDVLESHPGFLTSILGYDPKSNSYEDAGSMPDPAPVTTSAIGWKSSVILPGGEIRPGIRTPKVWRYDLK